MHTIAKHELEAYGYPLLSLSYLIVYSVFAHNVNSKLLLIVVP